MNAVHFGAGNIGRGFIGKTMADAGWRVCFADVNQAVIEALQRERRYPVRVLAEDCDETHWVEGVDGVLVSDGAALNQKISEADWVTTAVGVNILPKIAPALAEALRYRAEQGIGRPLTIVACENAVRASRRLEQEVRQHLDDQAVLENVTFVDCAVDRIVPPTAGEALLAVSVEAFSEWVLDRNQYSGELWHSEGVVWSDRLDAFVARKLFTLNTGHAAAAYWGHLAGLKTVREALLQDDVREKVITTMQESGAVLIQRYGFDAAQHQQYIDKIIQRFLNPYLQDEVTRVGRDPLRKISANDRIMQPLRGTLEYALPHQALVHTLAAALHYRNPDDAEALQLAQSIDTRGLRETVADYCGVTEEALLDEIERAYQKISPV